MNEPNTPASDQPERPTCFTQECAIGLHSACDGGVPFSTGMIPCRCECHRSDQPEYRPLGPDEEIHEGDIYQQDIFVGGPWQVIPGTSAFVGQKCSQFPNLRFRRPIAAEKREDTRTCGEISCDECNERYQKAIAEISTLQQQLAQEKEARETLQYKWDAETCSHCGYMRSPVAPCKCGQLVVRGANDHLRKDRDNLREALEKAETLIRHLPCHCGNFGPNLKCPCCQAKAAIQQSEGK